MNDSFVGVTFGVNVDDTLITSGTVVKEIMEYVIQYFV